MTPQMFWDVQPKQARLGKCGHPVTRPLPVFVHLLRSWSKRFSGDGRSNPPKLLDLGDAAAFRIPAILSRYSFHTRLHSEGTQNEQDGA
jgi:hypothetical protein